MTTNISPSFVQLQMDGSHVSIMRYVFLRKMGMALEFLDPVSSSSEPSASLLACLDDCLLPEDDLSLPESLWRSVS